MSWNADKIETILRKYVSLFVRLWVEIIMEWQLKKLLNVSLFVRLWVEIVLLFNKKSLVSSASSWGCELKWLKKGQRTGLWIVSLFVRLWVEMHKNTSIKPYKYVSLFVRLWVEINIGNLCLNTGSCQPLREAVSWNTRSNFCYGWRIVSLFVRLWVEILMKN